MRRALIHALTVAVLAVASASCLSPTLPLPPPEVSSITQAAVAGSWDISGDCTAGAIVIVVNAKTGLGAAFEDLGAKGFFSVTVEGAPCDTVEVWEDLDQETSSVTTVVLQATTNGEPTDPTLCQ